ncbi:MICOS complex subunit MIC27 isoform X2 [Esox lucius]|uniref:MICOS complex subunit n=1 Tax=Esox lucius TaxID=8010 RepID=A0AAY5KDE6_ESOLU|nr:MICOS complex subunit MIC27 isoform X2 [Esox lucius]
MATTVVKLVAIPAAIGLASFRVYATSEDKTKDVLLSPRELSIYAQDPSATRYLDEQPGPLERGLGRVRVGLQPYVRALKNNYSSAKVGAVTVYTTGHDTYEFLRSPPPGFIPRVSVITVSGLAGLILARKGSSLKRMGIPLALAAVGTAVCYPAQTVSVVKVTGQKIYAGSQYTTSSVASVFKSKPKEFTPPTVSLENQALPWPETSEAEPDLHPTTELPHTEGSIDTKPSAGVPLKTTDVLEQEAVQIEIVPATESAHVEDDGHAHAQDAATVEAPVLVTDEEAAPPVETVPLAPISDTVHAPPPTEAVFLGPPLSEMTGIEEAFPTPVDRVVAPSLVEEEAAAPPPALVEVEAAAPPPALVEEEAAAPPPALVEEVAAAPPPALVEAAAPPPAPVEEVAAAPPPVPVEEEAAAPPPVPVEEEEAAAPPPVPVEEEEAAAPPPVPVEEEEEAAAPPPVPVEEEEEAAAPPPVPVEEEEAAAPPPAPVEEVAAVAAPPPAPVEAEEPSVIVIKTAGKPKFAPDPKLVDMGQASPEDEDLYSTRG